MDKIIFKPKFSLWGWLLPLCFIGFLTFLIWVKYPQLFINPSLRIKHGLFVIPLSLFFVFDIVILFTMQYEFRPDALILRGGPFVYKIPYSDIKQISKTDLMFHPIACNRYPGFAFGDCYYADAHEVTMCATRMCKGIILIQTIKRLYGITPKDEDLFITELKKRIKDAISD